MEQVQLTLIGGQQFIASILPIVSAIMAGISTIELYRIIGKY